MDQYSDVSDAYSHQYQVRGNQKGTTTPINLGVRQNKIFSDFGESQYDKTQHAYGVNDKVGYGVNDRFSVNMLKSTNSYAGKKMRVTRQDGEYDFRGDQRDENSHQD